MCCGFCSAIRQLPRAKDKPGMILDYTADGSIVGMEMLDASKRMSNLSGVEYTVVGVKSV